MYWTWPAPDRSRQPRHPPPAGRRARLGDGRHRLHPRADPRGRRRLAPARRRRRADDRAPRDARATASSLIPRCDHRTRGRRHAYRICALGSHPSEAAHRPSPRAGFIGRGDLLRGSGHLGAGSAGRTASSITSGRRRGSARSRRPGSVPLELVEEPVSAASSFQDRDRCRPSGDPISRARPAPGQRRCDDEPLPPGRAAGGALPQRGRRRGAVHPSRPGDAPHDVRPAAVPAVRLRRHPAVHDVSPGLRRRLRARPARLRIGRDS